MGGHRLSLRHDGVTASELGNQGPRALFWEARFPGRHAFLLVDGKLRKARQLALNGVSISAVSVTVPPGGLVSVAVPQR
jgi:hypothetical protein